MAVYEPILSPDAAPDLTPVLVSFPEQQIHTVESSPERSQSPTEDATQDETPKPKWSLRLYLKNMMNSTCTFFLRPWRKSPQPQPTNGA